MKRSKSIISIILSIIIAFSCVFCAVPAVSAASTVNYDGVIYTQVSPYEAKVYGYEGKDPNLTIPERVGSMTVTGVDSRAFYQNSVVKQIILPRTVRTIGDWAFAYCPNLEYVNTSYNLTSVGFYAFAFSPSLEEVNINSDITELTPGLFQGSGLTSIRIPYNVKTIRRDVFSGCANLKSINIPAYVTSIDIRAFINCTSLESVNFGSGSSIPVLPSRIFSGCTALKEVSIPSSVKSIDSLTFENCTALESIYITDSTSKIADDAFNGASSVTIKGNFGSYAEQYAVAHDIPFMGNITHEVGDVDLDGIVCVIDATAILKHIVRLEKLVGESYAIADVDKNGVISVSDATLIQKMIVGLV